MTQAANPTSPTVMLLTRVGCHLCGLARSTVAEICAARGLPWHEVDVDSDAELRAEYSDQVPVLLVGDEPVATLTADRDEITRALQAAA